MIHNGKDYIDSLKEIWSEIQDNSCVTRRNYVLNKFKGPFKKFDKIYNYKYNYLLNVDESICICGKSIKIINAIYTGKIILIIGTTCLKKVLDEGKIITERASTIERYLKKCPYCLKEDTYNNICKYCKLIFFRKCEYCAKYKIEKDSWKFYCDYCEKKCYEQEIKLIERLESKLIEFEETTEKNDVKNYLVKLVKFYNKHNPFIEKNKYVKNQNKLKELIQKSYIAINQNNDKFNSNYNPCLICLRFEIEKTNTDEIYCNNCL